MQVSKIISERVASGAITLEQIAVGMQARGKKIGWRGVYQWQQGLRDPRSKDLGILAEVLGCSVQDFYEAPSNGAGRKR